LALIKVLQVNAGGSALNLQAGAAAFGVIALPLIFGPQFGRVRRYAAKGYNVEPPQKRTRFAAAVKHFLDQARL
jgi:hypothetical protein